MADDDIREAANMTDRDAQGEANLREHRDFIARSDALAKDRLAREAATRRAQQIRMRGKK